MNDLALNSLCAKCKGTCCSQQRPINIQKNEADRLRQLGAKIERNIPFSDLVMIPTKNGCVFLKDGRCSIYAQRPKACKTFDCRRLLRSDPNCFFFQDNPQVKSMLQTSGVSD